MAILCHGDFAPLFGPDSRAEVPIVGMVNSGDGAVPINGRVDRLLVDALSVRIIDYKTDRPGPSSAQEIDPGYIAQMAEYRVLLNRIFPNKTIDCSLLWTDGPCLMVIPEELLDAHASMAGGAP
jgi:ATP-dependent helicase/nuclease subunit A